MTLKQEWVEHCLYLSRCRADFYSGARKIIRGSDLTFRNITGNLTIEDSGFTKSKMTMLSRNYFNEESHRVALMLWEKRLKQDKYGSVGVSTYNHLIKGDVKGATPRGSVFGPCIQSITVTYLNKRETAVDVFYRTTELFKKFPADLVFIRDVLLRPFNIKPIETTFHFANITMHPMYFVTIIPHLIDPVKELEKIRKADPFFFNWVVKWSSRYLVKEHQRGIAKFAQALRVQMDTQKRIDKATLRELIPYFKKHHPGYRNEYTPPEEEED